ncbi:MAG: acyl-CoA reductase [Thermoanaerobaculia bacterium]
MIHDAALPLSIRPSSVTAIERQGIGFTSARWSPADLERLMAHLSNAGAEASSQLRLAELQAVWEETVADFVDPGSAERRNLDPALARSSGLSPAGLQAALEVVLGGVSGSSTHALVERAATVGEGPSPLLVILSSNLPGLAVQSLLPALLLRRPILLKSPTSETLFTPAFVRALAGRQPELGEAVAAVTWPGGDQSLEAPVLAAAGRVLAYGEASTIASLERRAPAKVYAYGPKTSLAVIGSAAPEGSIATGLARDIALFDQRGCLSIQASYTAGDAIGLAEALAEELSTAVRELPPGPLDPVAVAGVQQIRMEAALRGLYSPELPIDIGTVVIEPRPEFQPSPGLRTVRIHPVEDLAKLPEILAPWSGQMQGAALAGDDAWRLRPQLESLGVSRCAAPGHLQAADATWHNGGIHPFEALTGRALGSP